MPEPAAKSGDAHGEKKGGLNWGLPLFIIFMGVGVSFAAQYLYDQKRSIEWLIEMVFRVGIPLGLVILLISVFKNKKDDSKH